ncbi:MAG: hypothetical protein ACRDLT_01020 [Solirubrobacteraceae bacterium]
MSDESERRLARNEALFRETNEAIERGQWPDDPAKLVRFRCECARLDCGEAVELTLAEYEQIRSSPRRFVIIPGHETPEIEIVISRAPDYLIVEKQDKAGETATARDPRQ